MYLVNISHNLHIHNSRHSPHNPTFLCPCLTDLDIGRTSHTAGHTADIVLGVGVSDSNCNQYLEGEEKE